MAKDNERQIARTLYIEKCLTAKEIAVKLKTTEKTIGNWVNEGKWKELRLTMQSAPDVLITKYKELLTTLLDKRLKMEKGEKIEGENMHSIIDEMSKVSAMIERLQTENRASLGTHINCIERFMNALHKDNPKLLVELIPFQEVYLTQLVEDLK